jgi:hypothetical protein
VPKRVSEMSLLRYLSFAGSSLHQNTLTQNSLTQNTCSRISAPPRLPAPTKARRLITHRQMSSNQRKSAESEMVTTMVIIPSLTKSLWVTSYETRNPSTCLVSQTRLRLKQRKRSGALRDFRVGKGLTWLFIAGWNSVSLQRTSRPIVTISRC